MPLRRPAAACALLLLFAAPATAGVIRGQLWRSKAVARTASRPVVTPASTGLRRIVAPLPPAQPGITDASIWIDRVPESVEKKLSRRGWFAPKPRLARIVQSKSRFTPRVLAVPAGSDVEFQNLDRVYHNAFSVSAARRFDLGKYPPGRLDTVRFERPGVVNIHCDIHPSEIGFVVVTPNHAYARPDSLGRFKLPNLPPGAYTLRVWHPQLGELRRKVEVPKRGDIHLEVSY